MKLSSLEIYVFDLLGWILGLAGQDMLLLGPPGSLRRKLAMRFCSLVNSRRGCLKPGDFKKAAFRRSQMVEGRLSATIAAFGFETALFGHATRRFAQESHSLTHVFL